MSEQWQKFQLFMLGRLVRRRPSLVDRKIGEVAREGALKYGRPELEEELVEWQKMIIDKTLRPDLTNESPPCGVKYEKSNRVGRVGCGATCADLASATARNRAGNSIVEI